MMRAEQDLPSARTVLDLPHLYQHPPADVLEELLEDLAANPAAFAGPAETTTTTIITTPDLVSQNRNREGLARYLTSIVGSSLSWIHDDDVKERIWAKASARLSERAGRTATPSFTRVFKIPSNAHTNVEAGDDVIFIELHEPSLTGDNLGHKTWGASYTLSRRLSGLGPQLLASLHASSSSSSSSSAGSSNGTGNELRVLELGAGTGLVGLSFASMFRSSVLLTDLPEIVENLETNVSKNREAVSARGSNCSVAVLDWSRAGDGAELDEDVKYSVILAADPIYSHEHPAVLVDTVKRFLRRSADAKLLFELPARDAYRQDLEAFKVGLREAGLEESLEGTDTGFDDWGEGTTEVSYWWGLWKWTLESLGRSVLQE